MYHKLIIKIGTSVLTGADGLLDARRMENLVSQICALLEAGVEVVVVSSGAMGAGRGKIKKLKTDDAVHRRQVLAAVGQVELMSVYARLLERKALCAQVLATKEDFKDKTHHANMKNCFEALLSEGVLPIVNENDAVSVQELMFTDNDELAGLIAAMLGADALIILTNVDGLYDGDPKQARAELIREVKAGSGVTPVIPVKTGICRGKVADSRFRGNDSIGEKSSFGRGGIKTKCATARKLSALGITTHIANGQTDGVLIDLVMENKRLGTKFLPARTSKASSAKRKLGFARGQERGVVFVNACAEEALLASNKANSLLPVGITKVEGEFFKGDLIKIKNEDGEEIGIGAAEYDSGAARRSIGKKGQRELIHYNNLFLY